MTNSDTAFYSQKNILKIAAVTGLYLIISALLLGFKTDQLVLAGIFNSFYFFSPASRKFILAFAVFIVYWVIYDYMKAFPNYKFNSVHIEDLYGAEKSLFGINATGKIITPNEYWIANQNSFLDVMTGVFYLCWIPVPLAFAAWLFFKDKNLFLQFSLTFVSVNFIGFIIYYVYPAAPPWYIQEHGNTFIANTAGNTAGLVRFDKLLGVTIFQNLYSKGSNVFAAMPSLHSSYPLVVFYYGLKKKMGLFMNIIFATVMVGIWFAAVYTSHHYVLDVLAGIACAILAIVLFQNILMKNPLFNRFLNRFHKIIAS